MNEIQTQEVNSVETIFTNSGESVFEMMAEYMVESLTRVRDTLSSFIKCTEGAEKAKAEEIKEQVEDYLEQLKKAKKLSGLQSFFKALGILGFIIALLAAVFCPTPMTIGLAIAATAMFLEPLIAQATGNESVIQEGMATMFNAMSDKLGVAGAAVMGAIMMAVICIVLTTAAAGSVAAVRSAIQASTESVRKFATDFIQNFPKCFSTQLTKNQDLKLRQFLEYTQGIILLAQSGVQVSMALLQLRVAELMKSYDISQALIDQWSQLIAHLNADTTFYQDTLAGLQNLLSRMFNAEGVVA